jgi:ABC-type transport system involved in multi-copper enzyme maturation permease subunit
MFRRILWKEWKENLWKLWFCGGAGIAFTIMLFRMRIIPDVANCVLISLIQMFVVPVVYALDIFSGEVSNRTVHLLFKIPIQRWIIFFSKYLLFTWFCAFGCQSRSEASSLIVMFSVFIGWGIVFLWSSLCHVIWIERFVPYSFLLMRITKVGLVETVFSQSLAFVVVLGVACYRYVSIRRYL